MYIDEPTGAADETVAWGSDVAAQMLRRLGIPYVSLNPGASYRGLHDSLVNHLGNGTPASSCACTRIMRSRSPMATPRRPASPWLACCTAMGLMHGMMSLYNAWCDRVPMIVLGATGPLDAAERRPWIDWLHTTRDQGALIRSFIKWDDQPSSAEALVESMPREHADSHRADGARVRLSRRRSPGGAARPVPYWPDLGRFASADPGSAWRGAPVTRPALSSEGGAPADDDRRGAQNTGRRGRPASGSPNASARAWSPISGQRRCSRPTTPPMAPPVSRVGKAARELIAAADVIWPSAGSIWQAISAWVTAISRGPASSAPGRTMCCTTASTWITRLCHRRQLRVPTGRSRRRSVGRARAGAPRPMANPARRVPAELANSGPITLAHVATTLRSVFEDPDKVSFAALCRGLRICSLARSRRISKKDEAEASVPDRASRSAPGAHSHRGRFTVCRPRRRRLRDGVQRPLDRRASPHSSSQS